MKFGFPLVALAGLLCAGVTPAAASAERHPATGGLTDLVVVSAERLLLADKVAAAKFGTSTPIVDPVREQQVLDQAAALATQNGIDRENTVQFFRAQIEMNKHVQLELFDLWTQHPELAPTERPDLATEVRPQLDRITTAFISELVETRALRARSAKCNNSLVYATVRTFKQLDLDRLHRQALRGAVNTVCA